MQLWSALAYSRSCILPGLLANLCRPETKTKNSLQLSYTPAEEFVWKINFLQSQSATFRKQSSIFKNCGGSGKTTIYKTRPTKALLGISNSGLRQVSDFFLSLCLSFFVVRTRKANTAEKNPKFAASLNCVEAKMRKMKLGNQTPAEIAEYKNEENWINRNHLKNKSKEPHLAKLINFPQMKH